MYCPLTAAAAQDKSSNGDRTKVRANRPPSVWHVPKPLSSSPTSWHPPRARSQCTNSRFTPSERNELRRERDGLTAVAHAEPFLPFQAAGRSDLKRRGRNLYRSNRHTVANLPVVLCGHHSQSGVVQPPK